MSKKIIFLLSLLLSVSACHKQPKDGDKSGRWEYHYVQDHFNNSFLYILTEQSDDGYQQNIAFSCESHNNNSHLVSGILFMNPGMTASFVNQYIPVEYRIDDGDIQKGNFFASLSDNNSVYLKGDHSFIQYLLNNKNGHTLYFNDRVSSLQTSFSMSGFSDFADDISEKCSK